MRIRWTRQALLHLAEIHDHIAADSPAAARRVVRQIRKEAGVLAEHPAIGRPGRLSGTRELVVARYPYIIAYRIEGAEVQIAAVVHTSRRWPAELPPA